MKMMRSLLACRRITAVRIKPRANSLLNALDHRLVFHFDAVQIGSGTFVHQRLVADIGQKFDHGFRRRNRPDDIYRDPPRIKIEHQIWEKQTDISRRPHRRRQNRSEGSNIETSRSYSCRNRRSRSANDGHTEYETPRDNSRNTMPNGR